MKKKDTSKKYKSVIIFNNNNMNKTNKSSYIFNSLSLAERISYKKEENFYYDKSQKEMMLSYIKNSQLNLLNKIDTIESDKEKIKFIKELLNELKGLLAYLFNEKIRNKDYLQTSVNNNKIRLQNEIKKKYKYDKNDNLDNNSIKHNNIFKNRIKKETQKTLDTEMAEKNYIGSELSKLKLQNFKTENEIIKTDFLIINKRKILNYIKNTNIFPEENKEIYCYNNDTNEDKIKERMIYLKNKQKNKLLEIMNKSKEKKNIIEIYINNINKIKNEIRIKNEVLANEIIYETSMENKITNNS